MTHKHIVQVHPVENGEVNLAKVTITYLGKEYTYPLVKQEDIVPFSEGGDRIVDLHNFEFTEQGYRQCYNETKRFHFVVKI